ncbi:DUF6011 domain-containing protein [Streptomyces sp. NPDC059994]|uniref:DUF6011 domain-containing protein n=1 Tax=Streptomyces sp. NPDC059994 TaxID=3347029 RepID=UPI003675B821
MCRRGGGGPVTAPRCGSCGRLLRDPASVARGAGPRCFRAAGGRTAPRLRTPAAAPPPVDGQTELPAPDDQLTLWRT